ncbi:MAG: PilZ domain-containing protein [Nitrospiraceae bacterium]|nr:MAG: PilZ domain-containing protein [Nitrospiraceae bacterium]
MEKRRGRRIIENLDAELTAGDTMYSGIVMNFSEDGLYMVTATSDKFAEIDNHSGIKLKCRLPSGEALNMDCEIRWFQAKTSPHGTSFSMGMEIIKPPERYRKFVKSLE